MHASKLTAREQAFLAPLNEAAADVPLLNSALH